MKSDMMNHLKKEHPGRFMETSTLSSVLFQDKGVRVLFNEKEMADCTVLYS
jgi:hypothetical protein